MIHTLWLISYEPNVMTHKLWLGWPLKKILTGLHKVCLGDYLFDFEKIFLGNFWPIWGHFEWWVLGFQAKFSAQIGVEYSKWPNFDLELQPKDQHWPNSYTYILILTPKGLFLWVNKKCVSLYLKDFLKLVIFCRISAIKH